MIAHTPIDMGILRDVTGDKWDGMRYLTDIYIDNSQKSFNKITVALQMKDAKALQMVAHGCAGSSASFGAGPLAALLHELEAMGKQSDLTNAPLKLEACRNEFKCVVSYLKELFAEQKAP
jgi:HPt (histidine-containing phosphotransfer) domain-containing protein